MDPNLNMYVAALRIQDDVRTGANLRLAREAKRERRRVKQLAAPRWRWLHRGAPVAPISPAAPQR
jgi:hypothetical protein